ncbi:hypothetical protein [Agrobacterium sp. Azo12]|uniref:hypothetical protein n=1 Tax=Agrobacterium sp. Azo12 TaxID=3031129 RepID=UPI0023D8A33C|nr:hypothetical protein [Agrobacterium sp. Azo12]MDO5897864.1 hypothetical protein [Agrobacterium sp. Azo12]
MDKQIDVAEENLDGLPREVLLKAGDYIATQLRSFQDALSRYKQAKSAQNRENKFSEVHRYRHRLLFAVRQMKDRVETEEKQRLLFYVDDNVYPPFRFTNDLTATVSYRWREKVEDDWILGQTTFRHRVVRDHSYVLTKPKRKLSAAMQAQLNEDALVSTWEGMVSTILCTLRDYFAEGGDGNAIPENFLLKVDRSGGLNNFSARFWDDEHDKKGKGQSGEVQ